MNIVGLRLKGLILKLKLKYLYHEEIFIFGRAVFNYSSSFTPNFTAFLLIVYQMVKILDREIEND